MAKNKTLADAQKRFAKIKASTPAKGKAGPPETGKCDAEVTSALFGKDNFKNVAFNFEFKVLTGPNQGRTLNRSVPLEYNPPEGHEYSEKQLKDMSEKKIADAFKFMDAFGIQTLDRDEVEALEGATVAVTLWKHPEADAKRWPTIYANKLLKAADGIEEPTEQVKEAVAAEADDEYEYEEE